MGTAEFWINLIFGGAGFVLASLAFRYRRLLFRKPAFAYPAQDSAVPHRFECGGTCSRWAFTQPIWIFVGRVDSGRLYPQRQAATKELGGKWHSVAHVGADSNSELGHSFVLYSVTADAEGTSTIREYIAQCLPNENWPGLDRWPDGCTPRDSVYVTHGKRQD